MARALKKLYTEVFDFKPTTAQLATVGPTTFPMFPVYAGWRVLCADINITELFTAGAPTIEVGDGTNVDGFIEAADITIGTAGIYQGIAAFHTDQLGKLYTTDDTVDLVYTGDALTTAGVARVVCIMFREF